MYVEKDEAGGRADKASKVDVSKILAVIPPAAELKKEKKTILEKRVRIKFEKSLQKPIARIPVSIANELGVKSGDVVEVVVAGKRKVLLEAEVVETNENFVVVYPIELEKQGVSDNSIATIRKARSRGPV